ncbi:MULTISPECIES: YkvA family protein [unclassified Nostoc]|uniref:YkvA family protein n=1 Tax=unclassified Nostoc TaxID=2593658 RepID=UPI002AD56C3A|nr:MULTISPECIES: YkvA family protein [unclassified Nostoc]MDZ8030543.1 YkvA family protein [Nostoc sp. DedSLP04]MDZ8090377.1 YkvA family protein [Nostoc sp. DedQUE05]MDZ8136384.1 YkvA family protein [Nostoc sp. DedQUE04]
MKFSIQSLYTWYRSVLRNPKYRWWVILGTLVYLVSPFDVLPDFIPVAGQIDDVFLLTLLVGEVSGLVIEGWKARKGEVGTEVPNTPEGSTSSSSGSTIDVDAVSVK